MQIYTKFANFTGLHFPHFTTIRNFTHLKMLFPAMVMDLVLLVKIKISSIAGIAHFHLYLKNSLIIHEENTKEMNV